VRSISIALIAVILLFTCGCQPERDDGQPVTRQPNSTVPNTTKQPVGGYVQIAAISSRYKHRPKIDELSTIYSWSNGIKTARMAPGLNWMSVDGDFVHLDGPVSLRGGRIFVPHSASDSLREMWVEPAQPAEVVIPFHVVIDPGHGGHDPGAIGKVTRVKEKKINLAIAMKLDEFLRASGVTTTLTRRDDKFVELKNRINIANRKQADLFVSIHANSSKSGNGGGFEIFDRDPRATPSRRAKECAKKGPPPAKYTDGKVVTGLAQRQKAYEKVFAKIRKQSREAALLVRSEYKASLQLEDRGVKSDKLMVLRWAEVPAILVETAFLNSRREEAMLNDPAVQEKMAEAIGRGILRFRTRVAASMK